MKKNLYQRKGLHLSLTYLALVAVFQGCSGSIREVNVAVPPGEPGSPSSGGNQNVQVSGAEVPNMDSLPLGDGKYSSSPKVGHVFTCQTRFDPDAIGASAVGPWIDVVNKTYNALMKVVVSGSNKFVPQNQESTQNQRRIIFTNNLPAHSVGQYPIESNDEAYQYDRNPNPVSGQNFKFNLPLNPELSSTASCLGGGPIAIMKNGVALFHAVDLQGNDAVAHEIQDACGGHPEPTGTYHYHNVSECVDGANAGKMKSGSKHDSEHVHNNKSSKLIGYALDGFGLFNEIGEDSKILTNEDLDDCHGHVGEIEWNGEKKKMYHYHATREFPYTIGCFRGQPTKAEGYPGGPVASSGGKPGQPGSPVSSAPVVNLPEMGQPPMNQRPAMTQPPMNQQPAMNSGLPPCPPPPQGQMPPPNQSPPAHCQPPSRP